MNYNITKERRIKVADRVTYKQTERWEFPINRG
jgi:hypothetical protein